MARIMLIHGAFGNASCWDQVVPRLRETGHSVEAIDLPGAGADPTPVAHVTLDAYAETFGEEAPLEVWPRFGSTDHPGSSCLHHAPSGPGSACGTAAPAGSACGSFSPAGSSCTNGT